MPQTRVSFEMRTKARGLRNHATKAESLLWYELRALKSDALKFRRQMPIGPYIVDFACLGAKLVVEVDGDSHETEYGKRHDANRDAYLNSLGYAVMRVDSRDVLDHAWYVGLAVKEGVERCRTDPTRPWSLSSGLPEARPVGGHPPLKGEGKTAP